MTTRKWLAECHAWLDGVTVQYETSLGWVNSMGNMSPITHPHYLWRIRPATIMLNGTELPKPVSMGPSWLWFGKSEHTAQRAVYFNTREDRDAVYSKLVEILS